MSTGHVLDDGIKSIKDAWQREHTARFNLERMLKNTESENAKLQDERDRMYKANVKKNGEILRLLEENAKLRELARRFGEYVSLDRCEGCVMKRRCNNGDVEECWQMTEIRALANELGIEVD